MQAFFHALKRIKRFPFYICIIKLSGAAVIFPFYPFKSSSKKKL